MPPHCRSASTCGATPPPTTSFHSYNPIPTGDDTPALVRARLEELAYLNEWVRAFHEERKAAKAFLSK